MELIATIHKIEPPVTFESGFTKREFVVIHAKNPQYPQYIKFEVIKDNCAWLDSYQVGQEVHIHFDLEGREWTGQDGVTKCFNTLKCWRLVPHGQQAPTPQTVPTSQPLSQMPPQPAQPQALPGVTPPPAAADGIPF